MAGVNDNRNSPFSPFSVDTGAELRRPPYKGGKGSVNAAGQIDGGVTHA